MIRIFEIASIVIPPISFHRDSLFELIWCNIPLCEFHALRLFGCRINCAFVRTNSIYTPNLYPKLRGEMKKLAYIHIIEFYKLLISNCKNFNWLCINFDCLILLDNE